MVDTIKPTTIKRLSRQLLWLFVLGLLALEYLVYAYFDEQIARQNAYQQQLIESTLSDLISRKRDLADIAVAQMHHSNFLMGLIDQANDQAFSDSSSLTSTYIRSRLQPLFDRFQNKGLSNIKLFDAASQLLVNIKDPYAKAESLGLVRLLMDDGSVMAGFDHNMNHLNFFFPLSDKLSDKNDFAAFVEVTFDTQYILTGLSQLINVETVQLVQIPCQVNLTVDAQRRSLQQAICDHIPNNTSTACHQMTWGGFHTIYYLPLQSSSEELTGYLAVTMNGIDAKNHYSGFLLTGSAVLIGLAIFFTLMYRFLLMYHQQRQEREQLSALTANINEALVLLNEYDQVQYYNPNFIKLSGHSSHFLDKTPPFRDVFDDNQLTDLVKNRQAFQYHDSQLITQSGKLIDVSVSSSPMWNDKNQYQGNVILIRDIREEKAAIQAREEALNAAEENAKMRSEFLANMSHEIRTPLNGVLGMLTLIKDTKMNEEQKDYVDTAYQSGQSLLELLNNILDISKLNAKKLEVDHHEFNVHDLVESTVKLFSAKANELRIDLAVYIHPSIPSILWGDATRIRQILSNLVGNAVKFTQSGYVKIEVVPTEPFQLPIVNGVKLTLTFKIIDTGIGIAPNKQAHIFDPFSQADGSTTREFGGTGLGLSLCKQLTQLLGGRLGVTSVLNKGSTFWFQLSLKGMVTRSANVDLNIQRIALIGKTISTSILHDYLNEWGVQVINKSHWQGELPPECDVIMVDKSRSQNMDVFVNNIRTFLAHKVCRVIALIDQSSLSQINSQQKQLFDNVLAKPFGKKDIIKALTHDASMPVIDKPFIHKRFHFDHPVLLVEDNPVNQRVAQGIMQKLGLTVDLANDGEQALQKLQNNTYTMAFMDCQMPIKDGFIATKEWRAYEQAHQLQHLNIVALTAHSNQEDIDKCFASGMDAYVGKPFKVKDLETTIAKTMGVDT